LNESQRLAVGLLCDPLEEGWPSMDLVGDLLAEHLRIDHPNLEVTRVRPVITRRWAGVSASAGWKLDRLWGRFVTAPRVARRGRKRFDVYHIVDHSYAHLVHSLPSARTVVTCHDLDTFRCLLEPGVEPRSAPFRWMAERVLSGLRRCRRVVCVSAAVREELLSFGLLPADRVEIVPNGLDPVFGPGVDSAADSTIDRHLGPKQEPASELLHVGSTIPRKGIDHLIEVLEAVVRVRPDVTLTRVGGPFTERQAGEVRRRGLEPHIRQLPFLSRAEVAAAYRRADLVLLPSLREGFGLPVIEGLACGTPVVASDLPVLREVGGGAVTHVAAGDVAGWTEAVLRLLEEPIREPAGYVARVGAGIERAATFTWSESARRMARIYQDIASE